MWEPATASAKAGAAYEPLLSCRTLQTVAFAAALAIGVIYLVWFATLPSYPLQDFPNHLARGVALSDLLFNHGARFGSVYSWGMVPVPYVLHDLLLATLIEALGVQWGGSAFVTIVLVSLPLALLFYMRAARLAPLARPLVFMIGFYLATDCFFLLAFMGFRLALAFVIASLGWVEILRRRWSTGACVGYVLTLVCGYFTHLTAPVFFGAALGVSSVVRLFFRATTVRREAILWMPLVLLMLLHVAVLSPAHSAANPTTYEYFWGTWHTKLRYLTFEFTRFGSHLEQPMMLLLLACLMWPLRRHLQLSRLTQPAVLEPLAIAAAFLVAYFLMPQFYSDSAYVDVRAQPILVTMLLLACLNVPGPDGSGRTFMTATTLSLVVALSLTNFVFLVRHVGKHEAVLNQYRALADTIPPHSTLLPVHTLAKDGELRPLLHASGYAVADREAVTPYLFAGDRGDPMKYFRYRARPYGPEEDWYRARLSWDRATEQTFIVGGHTYSWRFISGEAQGNLKAASLIPVDWNRVACTYDYLLATTPVDLRLIEAPVRWVRGNRAAALFAVDRSECRPELLPRTKVIQAVAEH